MITRRSLFVSLAGLAAVPAVGQSKEDALVEWAKGPWIMAQPESVEWIRVQGCILPPFDREAAAATLDSLIEEARSNLSRPQRDKGAE